MFLGYPSGYKGYKLLNLETNEIFISRDVIFHEIIFPFKDQPLSPSSLDVFPDLVLPAHFLPTAAVQDSSSTVKNFIHPTRSQRISHMPTHLRDYHCYLAHSSHPSSTAHPSISVLDSHKVSPAYRAFVHSISSVIEPEHFSQAVRIPEWKHAMTEELRALESNGTWSIVSLPSGKTVVGCKWVYKAKFKVMVL